jgi:hypothetical protein
MLGGCVSQFSHHCNKKPEKNNLRKEKFVLAHSVRGRFQSMVGWLHCFGAVERYCIMAEGDGGVTLFILWGPESRERERMPVVDFLLLPLLFHPSLHSNGQCCPPSGWLFPPQFLSYLPKVFRNALTDKSRTVLF